MMDFVTGLLKTKTQKDATWIVVDRMAKIAHFTPVNVKESMEKLAQTYI
jgi:hypothetical protein